MKELIQPFFCVLRGRTHGETIDLLAKPPAVGKIFHGNGGDLPKQGFHQGAQSLHLAVGVLPIFRVAGAAEINHGARDPLVLGDYMYVVANDSVGSDYIALIQGGQFKRISSFEIDHRLGHAIDIVPIAMRGETYVMVRNNGGLDGFVFGEDKWWHWVHPSSDSDGIMKSVFKNFALTLHGALVKFDDDTRTTYLGGQIVRYIRDSFVNWHTRKLFRKVAVAMDSGRVTDPNINDSDLLKQIYIRLSTNRGLSFGQYLFRKLGRSGLNNKIIEWVGLGSGNSLLLEIGTSAGYKLQLYDIEITAQ